MNDVQQFIVKPDSQSIEQQQYQATSECWNLIVDEGLLQVYTYSRTSRIIVLLYNGIKDVKRKIVDLRRIKRIRRCRRSEK